MMASWYVEKEGRLLGPYTGPELKGLAATGRLEPGDLVRRDDRSKAVPAGEVRGLFPEADAGPSSGGPPPSSTAEADGPPSSSSGGGRLEGIGEGIKGLASASKAAARLAATQARKLHLERVALPAAYGALGRDIYDSLRFPGEFPDLYAEIGEAERRAERIKSARPQDSSSKGMADRAAGAMVGAKATAEAKALSLKKESLLRRLGESSYERHRESSGPEHLVRPISEARSAVEALEGEIGLLAATGRGTWISPYRVLGASAALGVVLLALAARWPGDEAASPPALSQEATQPSPVAGAPAPANKGSR